MALPTISQPLLVDGAQAMKNKAFLLTFVLASVAPFSAPLADQTKIELNAVNDKGSGASVGSVTVSDSEHGLILAFDLQELQPGPHRFNIHTSPNCEPGEIEGKIRAAGAAGPRWNIDSGANDFAVIYIQVDEDGALPYQRSLVAPGLTVSDLKGHSLVVHGHRDNYRYEEKLEDGRGPRVACGVLL